MERTPELKFCVVISCYYGDISKDLHDGAEEFFAGVKDSTIADVHEVPGALEIPPLISMLSMTHNYDGYIALGCVIRGETAHFDIVANESARGLMTLGIQKCLAIGNGILTVENMEQAKVRARNKGEEAAKAAQMLATYSHHARNKP